MSCNHFEERWADFFAGTLSDVEQRAAATHLEGCADCARLVAVMRDTMAMLPAAAPVVGDADAEAVTAAVLARTSGGACSDVQARLCDFVDGALASAENELMQTHLGHCARCGALRSTLAWLSETLPTMATLDPGPEFTRAVVAATGPQPASPVAAAWRTEWAERWRHWISRPRFAWEASYAGLLILVGLFGTSLSPFRDVPTRALAVVQVDPRATLNDTGSRARTLHSNIGAAGQQIWDVTFGAVAGRIANAASDYADRHPGMHEAYGNLQLHAGEIRQRIGDRNFAAASLSLHAARSDLRALIESSNGNASPPATPQE